MIPIGTLVETVAPATNGIGPAVGTRCRVVAHYDTPPLIQAFFGWPGQLNMLDIKGPDGHGWLCTDTMIKVATEETLPC